MDDADLTPEKITLALGGVSKSLDSLIGKAKELSSLIGSLEGSAASLGSVGDSTGGRGPQTAQIGGPFSFTNASPPLAPSVPPLFGGQPSAPQADPADLPKFGPMAEGTANQATFTGLGGVQPVSVNFGQLTGAKQAAVQPVSATFGQLLNPQQSTTAVVSAPAAMNPQTSGPTNAQTAVALGKVGIASFGLLPDAGEAITRKQRIYATSVLGTGGDQMMGPINNDVRAAMNGQLSSPNADVDVQEVAQANNMAFNATGLARVAGWLQPTGVGAGQAAQAAAGVYESQSANMLMNQLGIQVTNPDGSRKSPEEIAKQYYQRAIKPNRIFRGPEGAKELEQAIANKVINLDFMPAESRGMMKTALMQQIEADNKGMAWSMDPGSEFGKEIGALSSPAAEEGQYNERASKGLAISMDDAAEGYAKALDAATALKGGFNALYTAMQPVTGLMMQVAGGKVALNGNPTAQGGINLGRTLGSVGPALLGVGSLASGLGGILSRGAGAAGGAASKIPLLGKFAGVAGKALPGVGVAATVGGAAIGLAGDSTGAVGTEGNWADKTADFWKRQETASSITHPWTGIFNLPGLGGLKKPLYGDTSEWLKNTFGAGAQKEAPNDEGSAPKAGGATGAVIDPRSLIERLSGVFRGSSEKSDKAGDKMQEAGRLQLDAARTLKEITAGAGAAGGAAGASWATGQSRANTTLPSLVAPSGTGSSGASAGTGVSGTAAPGIAPPEMSAVEKQTYDFLKAQGFSKAGIAAVMGNIKMESTWDPTVVNSIGASGLFQWLGSRKANLDTFAASMKKPWQDVGTQLRFFMQEMGSYPDLLSLLKATNDPASAAVKFENVFERSGHIGDRPKFATEYFNMINKGSLSQGTMRVTHDQIVQAHEGEIIVPSAISTAFRTALAEHQAGITPRSNGTVQINVTLMNSSDAEARRLVSVVQEQIRESYGIDQLTRT